MSPPPERPRIYHITHVENLPAILASGGLRSDAAMTRRGGPNATIGMDRIKQRRLTRLPVRCHPGTMVGEYVPFYFCPRSVMLYVIRQANHPELSYRGGQEPILTLEAELREVVAWADAQGVRWAFSLSGAGANYAEFRARLDDLHELDWTAIHARDFRDPQVKERKQAEFLVHESFPWTLVREIGACNAATAQRARGTLAFARHRPAVMERKEWYF